MAISSSPHENSFDKPNEKGASPDLNVAQAENVAEDEHHHLHRGLKSRQITMIAIGGAIGTGLIIGTCVDTDINVLKGAYS
jgi:amino acid transporter